MSDFTYQSAPTKGKYETYEWDNVWLDHANDTETPRVLYIGDSISCGIRRIATAQTENAIYFDGFGTSKSLDNPWFKESLAIFAQQQPGRKIVLFNNGLHGWHLSDERYEEAYEALVTAIRDAVPAKHFFLILSTRLRNEERTERVKARNEAVKRIGARLALPVIDLYSVSDEHFDLLAKDGVHYTDAGYTLFAERIWNELKNCK